MKYFSKQSIVMPPSTKFWCDRKLIITVEGPDGQNDTVVEKPFARIGSNEASEIVLGNGSSPRRELYFHATNEGVFGVLLKSPLASEEQHLGWLQRDQFVDFGEYRVSVKLEGEDNDARENNGHSFHERVDLNEEGSAEAPYPIVSVSFKGHELTRRRLRNRLTLVGREKPSQLRIRCKAVSKCHCALFWDSGVLWVIDLLSTNSTRLNDRLIDVAKLQPGDEVWLEEVKLQFVGLSHSKNNNGKSAETNSADLTSRSAIINLAAEAMRRGNGQEVVDEEEASDTDTMLADEDLTSRVAQLENEKARLLQDIELKTGEWDQQRESLKKELIEAVSRLSATETDRQRIEQEHTDRVTQLEHEVSQQQETLQRENEAWDQHREGLQQELSQRVAQLSQTESDHQQTESKLMEQTAQLEEELTQQQEAGEQRYAGWEQHRLEGQQQRADLEQKIDEATSLLRVADVKHQQAVAKLTAQIDQLETKLSSQRDTASLEQLAWQRQKEILQQDLHDAADRFSELTNDSQRVEAELTGRITPLEEENSQQTETIQRQNAELAQEIYSWNEQREKLQNELLEASAQHKDLQSDRQRVEAELTDRIAQLDQQLAQLLETTAQQNAAWDQQRSDLQKRQEDLQQKLKESATRLSDSAADKRQAQEEQADQIVQLEETIASQQDAVLQERTQWDLQLSEWKGLRKSLEKKLDEATAQLSDSLTDKRQSENILTEQVAQLEEKIACQQQAMDQERATWDQQLSERRQRQENLEQKISEAASKLGIAKSDKQQAEAQLTEHISEFEETIGSQQLKMDQQCAEWDQKSAVLENQIETLQQNLKKTATRFGAASADKKQTTVELTDRITQLEEDNFSHLSNLDQNNTAWQEKHECTELKLKEADSRISHAEADKQSTVREFTGRIAELEKHLSASQTESETQLQSLERQLKEADSRISHAEEDKQHAVREMMDRVAQLNEQISELRQALDQSDQQRIVEPDDLCNEKQEIAESSSLNEVEIEGDAAEVTPEAQETASPDLADDYQEDRLKDEPGTIQLISFGKNQRNRLKIAMKQSAIVLLWVVAGGAILAMVALSTQMISLSDLWPF